MEKFLYYTYKVISFFIFVLGLIYLSNLNKILVLLTCCALVYLHLIYTEYEKSLNKKHFVNREIYTKLYEMHLIYKKYEDSLSPEDKESILKYDDDFAIEYSNKYIYK